MSLPPTQFYQLRPKLEEILEDEAPFPYTLSAFLEFLCRNHCLESLEFILEAERYRKIYSRRQDFRESATGSARNRDMMRVWEHIMTTYVARSAPHEINIPCEDRAEMLEFANARRPPPPDVLEAPIHSVHGLINDSILIPFFDECSRNHCTVSLSAPSVGPSWSSPSPDTFNTLTDRTIKKCLSSEVVSDFELNMGKNSST